MYLKQLCTYTCIVVIYVTALEYNNADGFENGDDWLMFYDEEGNPHVMNFSSVPNDTRGMVFGDAYYFLYTRHNDEPEELHVPENSNSLFTSQYFNSSNSIKVLAHGWLGSERNGWPQEIKNELLIKGDYNIITVDWNELSRNPVYPWAAFSTRYVGKKTAQLLDAIAYSYNMYNISIHLVGHSLGSHIMAYTAAFSMQKIQRITGLDPARPFFELPLMSSKYRLDKTDAEFVDIIHTCGGLYGYMSSHGHADFYPNNGQPKQPGCELHDVLEVCSHSRAHLYFKESINSEILFYAYPCKNWETFENDECTDDYSYMGYQAKTTDFGNYYLYTNMESPFAQGDKWAHK